MDWLFEIEPAAPLYGDGVSPNVGDDAFRGDRGDGVIVDFVPSSRSAAAPIGSSNVPFRPFDPEGDEFMLAMSSETSLPDVVVIGSHPGSWGVGGGGGIGGSYDGDPELTINPVPDDPPPSDPYGWVYELSDDEVIVIKWELGREPTELEKSVAGILTERVREADQFIKGLKDNEIVTLKSGEFVTGAELKAIWSRTDFIIREVGTPYQSSNRGQANFNDGDPEVSLNIDLIMQYCASRFGGLFLPLHELGHMRQDGSYRSEEDANDIARAISEHWEGGSSYLTNPNVVYNTLAPLSFVIR